MSDELTQAPRIDGEFWVIGDRRFARLRGAEEPPAEDTPAENAAPPDGTPAEPDEQQVDFEKRYNDLRPQWTQASQKVSQYEQLIDRVRQGDVEAAKELGLSFAEEENPDPGDEEEPVFQDPRVDQLLAQQAQQQEQAILNDVSGHIDTLLDEAQIEVPQRFKNAILSEAWLQGGGAQITPEVTTKVVNEWVDEYKALEKAAGDRYVASKKAPHVSKVGTGATEEVLPLDATHAQRVAFMKERLASEEQ